MLVGLISCTKAKTPHAALAREFYSSSALFRGALRSLEGRADVVYVLSPKYGLLPLDERVEPYEQELDGTTDGRQAWAEAVLAGLRVRHGASLRGITFEFHAGLDYRQPLEQMLTAAGAVCSCPVDGLPIGQRLAYYAGGSTVAVAAEVTNLRLFVWGLQGRVLETGTGEPFLVVEVKADGVGIAPERTNKPRPIGWGELERAWEYLRAHGSMTLAQVRQVASEASSVYVFALLGEVPQVRLEHGQAMRLRMRL